MWADIKLNVKLLRKPIFLYGADKQEESRSHVEVQYRNSLICRRLVTQKVSFKGFNTGTKSPNLVKASPKGWSARGRRIRQRNPSQRWNHGQKEKPVITYKNEPGKMELSVLSSCTTWPLTRSVPIGSERTPPLTRVCTLPFTPRRDGPSSPSLWTSVSFVTSCRRSGCRCVRVRLSGEEWRRHNKGLIVWGWEWEPL